MRAAANGEPYVISFGGRTELHYAPDVARALILAARSSADSAKVYDMPGEPVHMSEVVSAIEAAAPGAEVTFDEQALPFPDELPGQRLSAPITPLADGVAETIEHFRRLTRPFIPA
jgi:nucleoside-diphosphate-sugar epimerase